jgi:multiple sugar transport system substrate-binding protein
LTALSGGSEIDVFGVSSPPSFAAYQSKGQVLAIDDLLAENGTDTSGYQSTFDALKMDGRAYALPYKTSAWVVYYNKDIFDAAKVPYPGDDWTWEEYYETAGKLTSGEGNDKIYGSLNYQPTSMWWRIPANGKGANNPLDDSMLADWMQAAQFCKSLSDAGYQPPYADRADEAGADYTGAFLQNKYGMMFNGDWEIEMLNTAIESGDGDVNYDIAPLPHWEGEEAQTTGAPGLLMVASNSKHQKEAFDFITFCTGEEGAEILVENDYFPAWQSDEISKAYTEGVTTPEHIEYIVSQKINSQVPCDPNYNTAANICKEDVSLYLLGEQDIEKTKESIKSRFEKEITD